MWKQDIFTCENNMLPSHTKRSLSLWLQDKSCLLQPKKHQSEMVWYFIGLYIINRTLHSYLEMQNVSSCVQKYIFQQSKRNFKCICHWHFFLQTKGRGKHTEVTRHYYSTAQKTNPSLCTYQWPSWVVDPEEPQHISTTTITNPPTQEH